MARSPAGVACALLALAGLGCAAPPPPAPDEAPPLGRLPATLRPLAYALELEIVPERSDFRGEVAIRVELKEPRRTLWLHGRNLRVSELVVRAAGGAPLAGRWEQVSEDGVAAIHLPEPLGPGPAEIRVRFEADFDRQLKGLYRVDVAGDAYVFSQFEAIQARDAFPCFDEPAFKTPFDVTLRVPAGDQAIANARLLERTELPGGLQRLRFATTEPIPSYLVAFAVGPLDVVEAPPIPANEVRPRALPFRGVAARGRGPELAYALGHTPAILTALERRVGVAYPYDKLDVIAVPDFAAGAMENVGAITFRDSLLLVPGEAAPEEQRRHFAHVMAHELAHTWFGNLVTMPWWNDIWLNESFATWLDYSIIDDLYPGYESRMAWLENIHEVMGDDSLVSARRIRQPIESNHDIRNAFDGITYTKGSAVLAMFEAWLGPETFRAGLHRYLERHRFGNADAADLLADLSEVAGQDVSAPFQSFLDQPGVPLLEGELRCEGGAPRLALRQSRHLPLGSAGDPQRTWQVPACVRAGGAAVGEPRCALLTEARGELLLETPTCPDWTLLNAGGAGYYRWGLDGAGFRALQTRGWQRLSPAERLSFADSVATAFAAGRLDTGQVFALLEPLAGEPSRALAGAPMGLLRFAREQLVPEPERPRVEAVARQLYRPRLRELGWEPRASDDGEERLLRGEVVSFLIEVGRDPEVRGEAARRGRRYLGVGGDGALHPDAAAPDLLDAVAGAAVQEGGPEVFDAALAHLFQSQDGVVRGRLLSALSSTRDPAVAPRALALSLDARLRVNEVQVPLYVQMRQPETRGAAWLWIGEHYDELVLRIDRRRSGALPMLAARFCSEDRAVEVQAFFAPRIEALEGGPRNLAHALESIRLCAARARHQSESARALFARATP